jgi:hypothetical protein
MNIDKINEETTNYNIKYYFKIIDKTTRNEKNQYFVCDDSTTTDKNIAYEYYPTKYSYYQPETLYFLNNDDNCSLENKGGYKILYALLVLFVSAGLVPVVTLVRVFVNNYKNVLNQN